MPFSAIKCITFLICSTIFQIYVLPSLRTLTEFSLFQKTKNLLYFIVSYGPMWMKTCYSLNFHQMVSLTVTVQCRKWQLLFTDAELSETPSDTHWALNLILSLLSSLLLLNDHPGSVNAVHFLQHSAVILSTEQWKWQNRSLYMWETRLWCVNKWKHFQLLTLILIRD